jgi:sulfatase maturation enzyme AslB (radical SAM superfamily)
MITTPLNAETQTRFIRIPGELPVYYLPRDNHVLYYAPGYLATVATGQSERDFSDLLAKEAHAIDQQAGWQNAYKNTRLPSMGSMEGTEVARSLLNAARSVVRSKSLAGKSAFKPLSLTLYLNNCCNLRCSYCYSEPQPRSQVRLSVDKIGQAAKLVASNCAAVGKPLTLVCHGGGEPTLEQKYLERVLTEVERIARISGVPLFRYVATNGVMPAHKASWLAGQFNLIGLSCDGPPWIQDRQRPTWEGRPSSPALERTAQILRREKAEFQVRMTVTPATLSQLPKAADYICRSIQPGLIWVEPLYHGGRAREGFSPDDAPQFVEQFLNAREITATYGVSMLTSGNRLDQLHGPYCSLLQGSLQLLPDGEASACFKVVRSGENGNHQTIYTLYKSTDFILDQSYIRQLQSTLGTTPATCRGCVNEYHCTFGCPDHCLLDGPLPENNFRCQLGRLLTQQQLCAQGDILWNSASLNSGLAGKRITA